MKLEGKVRKVLERNAICSIKYRFCIRIVPGFNEIIKYNILVLPKKMDINYNIEFIVKVSYKKNCHYSTASFSCYV